MNENSPHCSSEHEVVLVEIKYLQEKLDKLQKSEELNNKTRIQAETIISLVKFLGVTNLITILGGLYLLFSK